MKLFMACFKKWVKLYKLWWHTILWTCWGPKGNTNGCEHFFLLASKNVIGSHSHLCCLHLKWVFPCQERMFTLTPPVVPGCSVTYAWRVSLKVTQSYGWLASHSIQAHWSQSTDVQSSEFLWTHVILSHFRISNRVIVYKLYATMWGPMACE